MMTERERLTCQAPRRMLDYMEVYHKVARTKSGRRKLRLFACACCRRLWHPTESETAERAVEVAERYADGLADKEELRAARERQGPWRGWLAWAARLAVEEKPQAATDNLTVMSEPGPATSLCSASCSGIFLAILSARWRLSLPV